MKNAADNRFVVLAWLQDGRLEGVGVELDVFPSWPESRFSLRPETGKLSRGVVSPSSAKPQSISPVTVHTPASV